MNLRKTLSITCAIAVLPSCTSLPPCKPAPKKLAETSEVTEQAVSWNFKDLKETSILAPDPGHDRFDEARMSAKIVPLSTASTPSVAAVPQGFPSLDESVTTQAYCGSSMNKILHSASAMGDYANCLDSTSKNENQESAVAKGWYKEAARRGDTRAKQIFDTKPQ